LKVEDAAKITAKTWKKLKERGITVTYGYELAKKIADDDMCNYIDSKRRGEKVEDAFIAIDQFGQVEILSVDEAVKQAVEDILIEDGAVIRRVKWFEK